MIINKNDKLLGVYVDMWLERISISCKKSTYSQYEYIVNKRIRPFFSNIKIKNISSKMVNEYTLSLIKEGLDSKTIREILLILGYILKIGGVSVDITRPKVVKKKIAVLSYKDQLLIEQEILKNINECNVGIYLCLYTGLRIGEICALKWGNIDLDKMVIKVDKTLIRVKNYEEEGNRRTIVILDEPKSISSIRSIPIPLFLIDILKKLKRGDECFFLTGEVKYMEPRSYRNYYRELLDRVGVDGEYKFHTLRHTFATRCIEKGFDPKTLSEILGHSNVKITLDRYVHPSFDSKVKMMNMLCPMV